MSFSPYGQDLSMLQAVYPDLVYPLSPPSTPISRKYPKQGCPLLTLPNELLLQILEYVLPRTNHKSSLVRYPRWGSGRASILRTCRRFNKLGTPMLYGDNEFLLIVRWHETVMCFDWETPRVYRCGGIRQTYCPFPGRLVPRHLESLTHIFIKVEIPDDYVTSQKFNIGPRSLGNAIRTQLERLCNTLTQIPDIEEIKVMVIGDGLRTMDLKAEKILEPLQSLTNVKRAGLIVQKSDWLDSESDKFKQLVESGYVDYQSRCVQENHPKEVGSDLKDGLKGVRVPKQSSRLKVFPSTHYLAASSAFYLPP